MTPPDSPYGTTQMPRHKQHPSDRPPRVRWTETEMAKLIEKAVDIQRDNPGLSGLPLLRAAMLALPPSRRRKLNAVTQAPWFEPGVIAEIKRRTAQERADAETKATRIVDHPDDPYRDILLKNFEANEGHRAQMARRLVERERFEADARQMGESILTAILLLVAQMEGLNSKFGSPAPVVKHITVTGTLSPPPQHPAKRNRRGGDDAEDAGRNGSPTA